MAQGNGRRVAASLVLTLKAAGEETFHPFFLLLQQGVGVRGQVGCGIRELLCEQFGIDPDYLKQRITTIFLNGKAIDDVETSRVQDGATLALSAAMPGLVGATMRRGGFYAAMRGAMTYNETERAEAEKDGTVRIKLFNLLLGELGPGFLRRGVFLSGAEMAEFLAAREPGFWGRCRQILLNGRSVGVRELLDSGIWPSLAGEAVAFNVFLEE